MNVDIIGGGISGLSSATTLKELNPTINVTLYEKYKTIGYNYEGRRCGEAYAFPKFRDKWKPDEKSIFNTITKWKFFFGEKTRIIHLPEGKHFILNRQEFINKMAKKTEKLGVKILVNKKIRTVKDLKCDYIIDASGCPSTVKREFGFPQRSVGVTYQQTIEDSNCFEPDTMSFYFSGNGYYWIFPRDPNKNEVNVGIGISRTIKINLKVLLEKFKLKQNIKGNVNYIVGGLVPIGIQHPLLYDNILFVGDAGIGCEPISGAGVPRGLISGHIAAKCIADQCVKKYPQMIKKRYNRWDMIEKNYIKMNDILYKLNPDFVIKTGNIAFKILNNI